MQSVKQGGNKYDFLSLWYDSIWNWTPVSSTIGEWNQEFLINTKHFLTDLSNPQIGP